MTGPILGMRCSEAGQLKLNCSISCLRSRLRNTEAFDKRPRHCWCGNQPSAAVFVSLNKQLVRSCLTDQAAAFAQHTQVAISFELLDQFSSRWMRSLHIRTAPVAAKPAG